MYKTFTKSKLTIIAAVASTSLLMAGSVLAKPEKNADKVPGPPGMDNIVEIAAANGNFTYLLAAAGCFTDEDTGYNPVVELLTGTDNLTLFAPVDDAFIGLQETLIGLWDLQDPEGEPLEPSPGLTCAVDDLYFDGALFTILAYHLTDGRRFSNSVFNKNNAKDIEMLGGGYITSTTKPSATLITNIYQMVGPVLADDGVTPLINIKASNGVIHVINTVMLPIDPTPPAE